MSESVIINIHPSPQGTFDFNIPFYGLAYDPHDFSMQVKKVAKDKLVILVSNGEPNSRLTIAAQVLKISQIQTKVLYHPACYSSNENLFAHHPWTVAEFDQSLVIPLIDYYLNCYSTLSHTVIEYPIPDLPRGYSKRKKLLWYHYGKGMPSFTEPDHLQLQKLFAPIFLSVARTFSKLINQSLSYVEDRLVLRLNHSQPESGYGLPHLQSNSEQYFIAKHIDTSVLTGWVYANQPGAFVENRGTMYPIDSLYNASKEMLIIPGFDYCDWSETMTPGTWHEVRSIDSSVHRVSVVAFLKLFPVKL